MITPTIGRVIWFQPPHAANQPDLSQPQAAFVTYVHSDRCINIGGFSAEGNPIAATSVLLLQDDDKAPLTGNYAQWMPYQVAAAKKA